MNIVRSETPAERKASSDGLPLAVHELFLVQSSATALPSTELPYTVLEYWHLCSLDAPTVAAVWTVFIGHAVGVAHLWLVSLSMFFAVWMLYVTDRLLDGRAQNNFRDKLEARHRFHQKHRSALFVVLIFCSVTLATLLPTLTHAELKNFSALGALLFTYFFLIHIFPLPHTPAGRFPKELAVGIFFAAAVFIPTVASAPQLKLPLLPAALLLASVCVLNCLHVYVWEHPANLNDAHSSTRFMASHLTAASLVCLAASGLLMLLAAHPEGVISIAAACGIGVLGIMVLHKFHDRIPPVTLRASVDLALVVPAPIVMCLLQLKK